MYLDYYFYNYYFIITFSFSPLFPIHSVEAEVMSMKSVLPADQAIASPRLHLSMSFFFTNYATHVTFSQVFGLFFVSKIERRKFVN